MLEALIPWLQEHHLAIAAVSGLSILLLSATLLATPWIVAQLPADYFRVERLVHGPRGPLRLGLLVVRNTAGVAFMLLGILMMVTPGPGLVCLILGLSLCEFPGKHNLLRRLAGHPSVFATLNWLRRKSDKPAFVHPQGS